MHKARTLLFTLLIALLVMACGLGGAPAASGDSVATIVASTIQAMTPAASTSTSTPTANDNTLAGVPVNYKNVSFSIPTGLATDAAPATVPLTTEQTGGPWDVAPEHTEFRLDNYYVAVKPFGVCQIDVYPADDYSSQYPGANISIQRLKGILGNPSATMTNETLPQVPYFNAASMFVAQVKRLHFANGDGIRMVTQYAQGFGPVSNDQTFYHFEGLTSDGKYYIVAVLPVQAPFLQNGSNPNAGAPSGGVPFPGMDNIGTPEVYGNYVAAVAAKLDATPADQFSPSLEKLDALVQSLKVSP